jgi:predicted nucleic acid-binding protein
MRFWESSAVVPLLVEEPGSARARALFSADADVVVWWATSVECTSSIARREREGDRTSHLAGDIAAAQMRRLRALAAHWLEVSPSEALREDAMRLLRTHALRSADALQLAAALAVCGGRPAAFPFVCADQRLCNAASREGFDVIDPL